MSTSEDEGPSSAQTRGKRKRQPKKSKKETEEIDVPDENSPDSIIISEVRYKYRFRAGVIYRKVELPNVLAVGPYQQRQNRGYDTHLEEMESIKKDFFKDEIDEKSKEKLRAAIAGEEKRIRKCYAKLPKFEPEQFVEMVVCDGFFIVQLFSEIYPKDDLLQRPRIRSEIMYDLLLQENQLPFFVLVKIYEILDPNETSDEDRTKAFADKALSFYQPLIGDDKSDQQYATCEEIKHLLNLIYNTSRWRPTNSKEYEDQLSKENMVEAKTRWNPYSKSIRCATELENAGIIFERRDEQKEKCRALDIEFKRHRIRKSKLRIPTLIVDENTERLLRNLILLEQSFPHSQPTYMYDYVNFLDHLINTGEDVQLLCYTGIIESRFGGDYQAVADIFNRLCDNAHGSACFYYSKIFEDLNCHCDSSISQQMAHLQRNYFNSAWAVLSFLAAVLLLFLTLAQTIFTLLSVDCVSCLVVLIVFGVSWLVIGIFCCMFFGCR